MRLYSQCGVAQITIPFEVVRFSVAIRFREKRPAGAEARPCYGPAQVFMFGQLRDDNFERESGPLRFYAGLPTFYFRIALTP